MTKADLITVIADKLKFPSARAEQLVDVVFGCLEQSIRRGEKIEIRATHPNYRAAMLADVLAGESPAGVALPGSTVVISAVRKGDQPGESADVKVLVGWCAGAPVRRSDPPGGRANGQAVAKVEDHKRTRRPRKSVPA